MEMQGKTHSFQLGIEILTPVQCGSGQELIKELDYVEKDGKVFIVDQTQSFNEIASNDVDTNKLLLGGNNLSDLVELAGYFGYSLPMFSPSVKVPAKIREHLKDALFQPYIAGSALKGAIRTTLVAEHLRSLPKTNYQTCFPSIGNKPKDRFADDKLLENLLGKEPKQDIFRALHLKDAMFKPEQLCLVDIRWLNLTGRAGQETAQWRSMANRNSFPNWLRADGICAEMLKPKSEASFLLQWDEFLLSDVPQWHGATNDILPTNFEDLKIRLNGHAKYRLKQEIDFYHRYGAFEPEQECQKLLNTLEHDPDSIFLQLSWGSGWRGMTGDWMDIGLVGEMRQLYNLGRTNMPFPKTRRLAVSGEPKLPLGWVRLFPYAQIEEKLKQEQAEQAAQKQRELDEIDRIKNLSLLEKELEDLKKVPEQEWDTRLLQKLEQAQWSSQDAKQVAEKIKQLMIKADKWYPDYPGSSKPKLKYKDRSLKVLKFLND